MKRLISIIAILFVLYGQNFAQWQKTNLSSAVKVNTLAISDSSIYAGTEGDGIFVSTDNGENWDSINDGLQSKVIYTIFINGKTIFAGTETGAYVSTNNGLNWNKINSGLSDNPVWSFTKSNIANSTQVGTTIFAGTWSGVYYSTNNGANWEVTGLSNTTMPVHSIVVYDNYIFAATLAGGIFCSQDNGITWRDHSILYSGGQPGDGAIVTVYSLSSIGPNVIVSAGSYGNIYYLPYTRSIMTPFDSSKVPYEGHPILSFAARNANLFAGNSIGNIFISEYFGIMWKLISYSLTDQAVYSLALNNSYILAGTENGIWRLWYPEATTNVDNSKIVPTGFALEQNYPNPFNPTTAISYQLPAYSHVSLKVYDVLGKEVATLVNENKPAGNYKIEFNAGKLVSGIYFYTIQAGTFIQTKKLLLLK